MRGPPDGGDEGGESSRGRGRRGERNSSDELHRVSFDDGNRAAGGVSQEAGGGEVGGSAVAPGRWAREHALP